MLLGTDSNQKFVYPESSFVQERPANVAILESAALEQNWIFECRFRMALRHNLQSTKAQKNLLGRFY
jgi:hypothetical protein